MMYFPGIGTTSWFGGDSLWYPSGPTPALGQQQPPINIQQPESQQPVPQQPMVSGSIGGGGGGGTAPPPGGGGRGDGNRHPSPGSGPTPNTYEPVGWRGSQWIPPNPLVVPDWQWNSMHLGLGPRGLGGWQAQMGAEYMDLVQGPGGLMTPRAELERRRQMLEAARSRLGQPMPPTIPQPNGGFRAPDVDRSRKPGTDSNQY